VKNVVLPLNVFKSHWNVKSILRLDCGDREFSKKDPKVQLRNQKNACTIKAFTLVRQLISYPVWKRGQWGKKIMKYKLTTGESNIIVSN